MTLESTNDTEAFLRHTVSSLPAEDRQPWLIHAAATWAACAHTESRNRDWWADRYWALAGGRGEYKKRWLNRVMFKLGRWLLSHSSE